MKTLAWTALVLLAMGGVLAAQDLAPAADAGFDWNNLWKMAVAGVLASVLGAWKNGQFNPKDLNPAQLAQKGIIGLVIGVVAGLKGLSIEAADQWVMGGALVYVLDYVLKALFKGTAIGVVKAKEVAAAATNPSPPPKP